MIEKRLPENSPQVKRKAQRVIPEGVVLRLKDVRKLSRYARAGKVAPGYRVKVAYIEWLSGYPGMTAAMWKAVRVIVSRYSFKDGKAWPSIEYIAAEAHVNIRTADRAIKFVHDEGIIFTKSGGRGGGGFTRSSHYVPNFRLILNADTGAIVKNAPYGTAAENWNGIGASPRGCQGLVRQTDVPKAVRQIDVPKKGKKRQIDAVSVRQTDVLRSDNVVGGAPAAPVSANATTRSAPAPSDKESNQREVRYISIKTLAPELDMTFEGLIELFDGKGQPDDIEKFDDFCKAQIFTFGKPIAGILKHKLPADVAVFGHVVIYGDKGKVEFVETGNSTLLLKKKPDSARRALGPDNWLAIDYRVSPAYQIEVAAKVQELRTGI